jgi:hypothetical protein
MKHLHRSKAIENYEGARLAIKEGLSYPSYILLKESLRATLAYINEDLFNKEYSTKTNLKLLLSQTPLELARNVDTSVFEEILRLEKSGLQTILTTSREDFGKIKKSLKKVIGLYLNENL